MSVAFVGAEIEQVLWLIAGYGLLRCWVLWLR